jgi:proteasome accessory factor C
VAKQSAPIQEVSRLLDLVPFISTHSYISVKDLAAEFGVSEKEITRELTALSMCGENKFELIDVTFESGYVTIRDHQQLDIPRALTNVEVASLLIGLELMRDGATDEHADVIAKIDSLINRLSQLVGEVVEVGTHPQAQHVALIERAIAHRSLIHISYEPSLGGEVQERTIEPLAIYLENNQTYLSAFCHKANAHRNFRLDRIIDISQGEQISEGMFRADVENSYASEKGSFSLAISQRRRSIAEYLRLDDMPAGGKVRVEAYSPEWIVKTVASFAPDISLLDPAESVAEVKRTLLNILDLYRS